MREILKERLTAKLINWGWNKVWVEANIDEWVDRYMEDEADAIARLSVA